MSLRSRLAKLERGTEAGRCPLCRDRPGTLLRDDKVLGSEAHDAETQPCRGCGWSPTVVLITVEVVGRA